MRKLKKVFLGLIIFLLLVVITVLLLSLKSVPQKITYGMSFNTMYARELGLDWKQTYDAILDDLKVRNLRLAAHWPMIEPNKGQYNFEELDYQIKRAEATHSTVILGVGRRLPRWPECHIPDWAKEQSWDDQKQEIREYITQVINRYKFSPAITYWQVENEPYLGVFATQYCGPLDEKFLEEEIALVKSLDGTRPVLVTDSGNLGTWKGAYSHGDAFGTSVYVYFWNPELGQFKTFLPPWFYRVKERIMKLIYGDKPTFLIELSAEPWLIEPIENVPIATQYTRMDINKFNDILQYAKDTRYDKQYLWGAEWWYWMKQKNEPGMWDRGKEVFSEVDN